MSHVEKAHNHNHNPVHNNNNRKLHLPPATCHLALASFGVLTPNRHIPNCALHIAHAHQKKQIANFILTKAKTTSHLRNKNQGNDGQWHGKLHLTSKPKLRP
jgi:hypothetical protein